MLRLEKYVIDIDMKPNFMSVSVLQDFISIRISSNKGTWISKDQQQQ